MTSYQKGNIIHPIVEDDNEIWQSQSWLKKYN